MSYCFDTISRVYRDRILPHVPDRELAEMFQGVLDEIHSANHNVPSANGVFKGDGLNKDPNLTAAVREMEEYVAAHPQEAA